MASLVSLATAGKIELLHRIREKQGKPSLRTMFRYCPQIPHPRQLDFLDLSCKYEEVLYGGAAGGGKSSALLMAALMYVHVPGYSVLILRRSLARLKKAGGIRDRLRDWLTGTDARWDGDGNRWIFPTGATIEFGYIDSPEDRFQYQSTEYDAVFWEEVTEFKCLDPETNPYLYMMSRIRQNVGSEVPARSWSATNPGNLSHVFFRDRFISDEYLSAVREAALTNGDVRGVFEKNGRAAVPSFARQNPTLDLDPYLARMRHLPPVTKRRLIYGDWSVIEGAEISESSFRYFKGEEEVELLDVNRKKVVINFKRSNCVRVMTVDCAGTSADKAAQAKGKRSSYSALGVWDKSPLDVGKFLLCRHVEKQRLSIPDLEDLIRKLYREFSPVKILLENEKFGQAIHQSLMGELPVMLVSTKGKDKRTRAYPLITAFERGQIFFPNNEPGWLRTYVDDVTTWTGQQDEPSDLVDMSAYAAIDAFASQPARWPMSHFHSRFRYADLPKRITRLGIGVAPASPDHPLLSSVMVAVAQSQGALYVDGVLSKAPIDSLLESVPRFANATFPNQPVWRVNVDRKYKHALRAMTNRMRENGLKSRISTKDLSGDVEMRARYLDSGVREGFFRYASSPGASSVMARISCFPDCDQTVLDAVWLASKAIAV